MKTLFNPYLLLGYGLSGAAVECLAERAQGDNINWGRISGAFISGAFCGALGSLGPSVVLQNRARNFMSFAIAARGLRKLDFFVRAGSLSALEGGIIAYIDALCTGFFDPTIRNNQDKFASHLNSNMIAGILFGFFLGPLAYLFHNQPPQKLCPALVRSDAVRSSFVPLPEPPIFQMSMTSITGGESTRVLKNWATTGKLIEADLDQLCIRYKTSKLRLKSFLERMHEIRFRTEIDGDILETFLERNRHQPKTLDTMFEILDDELSDTAQRGHSNSFFKTLNFDEFLDLLEGRHEINGFLGRSNVVYDLGGETVVLPNYTMVGQSRITDSPYQLNMYYGAHISHMGLDIAICRNGKVLQYVGVQFGKKAAYIVEIQGGKNSREEIAEFQRVVGLHPTEWLMQSINLYLFEGRKVEYVRGLGPQRIPDCIKTGLMEERHIPFYYKAYDVAGMRKKTAGLKYTRERRRDTWDINNPFSQFKERGGWSPDSVYHKMRTVFSSLEKTNYAPASTPQFPFTFNVG